MHPGHGGGRRHAICVALLCSLGPLTLPAALADSREAEVDFEPGPRGHLLLPVMVNGRFQGIFALDTGASRTVLTPEFAGRIGTVPTGGDPVESIGAHGSKEALAATLASVQVGAAAREDVEAIVMDLSHITGKDMKLDGVLGNNFLAGFDLLIDFRAGQIELAPHGTLARMDSGFETWMDIGGGPADLLYLDVTVNGQPATAVLDTGSGRSAINTAAAAALGLSVPALPPPGGDHGERGHGPVAALPAVSIDLAGARLDGVGPVAIVDLDIFERLGLRDQPTLLMGTNLLNDRRLGIDYWGRRLYL